MTFLVDQLSTIKKYCIIRFAHVIIVFILLSTIPVSGQPKFIPEFILGWGPGINASYFDIGGGSPGISLSASGHYRWTNNYMAGISLNYHLSNGTDEGTVNSDRGYNYTSNLFETTARLTYLFTFKPLPEKRWKKLIMPYIFAGAGCLVFFSEPGEYPGQKISSEYSHLAFIMNGGIGLHYKLNDYWSVGMEACLNLPFSDYLEGYSSQKSEFNDTYHNTFIKIIYTIPRITKKPLKPSDFR